MARKTGSHSEITGPRILDAALRLFAQHGYAAVSMRQIAADVGVQAGSLYNYTPDKQSLLFDLLRRHMEELLAEWATQDPPTCPRKSLEKFVRFHITFHLSRPDQVFISYMELRNLSAENFAKIETLRQEYEAHLAKVLQAGQATGKFLVPEPKITSFALIAMLTGVVNWFREDGRLSAEALQDHYWTLACQMVGACQTPKTCQKGDAG